MSPKSTLDEGKNIEYRVGFVIFLFWRCITSEGRSGMVRLWERKTVCAENATNPAARIVFLRAMCAAGWVRGGFREGSGGRPGGKIVPGRPPLSKIIQSLRAFRRALDGMTTYFGPKSHQMRRTETRLASIDRESPQEPANVHIRR